MRKKTILEGIEDLEKRLAAYKFVNDNIPDAKIHSSYSYHGFSAKSVNSSYTGFDFVKGYEALWVIPYLELDFEYNDKSEPIRINSSPRSSRLVYASYDRMHKQKVIKFSRLNINLKNNNFKEDMLNACRVKILEFIKERPGYKLDSKHLEPRLKKLLMFT
jgi:hypothetical protein